jgi:hypothetical protein
MVRLVLKSLESPWAFELMPGLNKLGRNPTNDFRVSDPSVSSFHAELTFEDEIIRVRDLNSTNGTFIDEARIQEAVLKPEHILRLGNVRFQLDQVPITPVSHAPPADQAQAAPACSRHPGVRAGYRCENCGRAFCEECVAVLGQSKFGATTICPACHGQCYPLVEPASAEARPSLLGRLTQTLKISHSR